MPGVNATTSDSTLLGATRRRVWVHPDILSHSLVVLTSDQLHVTPLTGAPKPEIVSAVEAGFDLGDLFGPLAVVVDLRSVQAVKLDLLTNTLVVEYSKRGTGTGRLAITFGTAETGDACFTKVWRRLGKGFELQPYRRDAWAAARAPLALLCSALVVTAVLAMGMSAYEDTASARAAASSAVESAKSSARTTESLIGWRGVCALGGAAAAVAQVWLYRRLTHPPERLELVRK
jgi:hypothetical protein